MTEKEIIAIYEKKIEIFLGTLNIRKSNSIVNTDKKLNEENKQFIKQKMLQMYANNLDEKLLDIAIDNLLPFLKQY